MRSDLGMVFQPLTSLVVFRCVFALFYFFAVISHPMGTWFELVVITMNCLRVYDLLAVFKVMHIKAGT